MKFSNSVLIQLHFLFLQKGTFKNQKQNIIVKYVKR